MSYLQWLIVWARQGDGYGAGCGYVEDNRGYGYIGSYGGGDAYGETGGYGDGYAYGYDKGGAYGSGGVDTFRSGCGGGHCGDEISGYNKGQEE